MSNEASDIAPASRVVAAALVAAWCLIGAGLSGCEGKPATARVSPPPLPRELIAERWMVEPGDAADAYLKAYDSYKNRGEKSAWVDEAVQRIQAGGRKAACDSAKLVEAFSQNAESVSEFLKALTREARSSEARESSAAFTDLETALVILGWRMASVRSDDVSEEGIVAFAGVGVLLGICEPIRESARARNEALPWLDQFSTALTTFFEAKKAEVSARISGER